MVFCGFKMYSSGIKVVGLLTKTHCVSMLHPAHEYPTSYTQSSVNTRVLSDACDLKQLNICHCGAYISVIHINMTYRRIYSTISSTRNLNSVMVHGLQMGKS